MTTTATEHTLDPTLDRTPARTASLSLARLHLLRFGYAFMGVGLMFAKWPLVVNPPESWPLAQSVVDSILIAMSVLALLGVRYPVRMLPVLLLESLWKLLWLGFVALPAAWTDDMNAAMTDIVLMCSLVVVVLVAIPWRYVWAQFVMTPGDRWR